MRPAAKTSAAAASAAVASKTCFLIPMRGLYTGRVTSQAGPNHAGPAHQGARDEQKCRSEPDDYTHRFARPSSEIAEMQIAEPADNFIASAVFRTKARPCDGRADSKHRNVRN